MIVPMTEGATAVRQLRAVALYLGGWLLLAVLFSGQTMIYSRYAGRPVPWRQAIVYPLSDMVAWSALALVALALARRFPLERGRWLRRLAVHVPAAFVLAVIEAFLVFATLQAIGLLKGSEVPAARFLGSLVVGKLQNNVVTYAVVVGCAQSIDYYRKFREREMRASQLEATLATTRLEALRTQLQPHFLFNTLHAISTLMHRDVEAADRMLARLSDLLRLSIESDGDVEVPLRRELEFLQGYLEIQQARFGERLKVRVDCSRETLDARVPRLFLQPLVENAIRHGLSARASGGTVAVESRRAGDWLRITVRDDGAGLPEGGVRERVGLANTRARLEALYGNARGLEITNHPEGGVLVTLHVPWRPAAAEARA